MHKGDLLMVIDPDQLPNCGTAGGSRSAAIRGDGAETRKRNRGGARN
ncbi:MAG: hypothetical protein WDN04_18495 [Rhodospirillales bacterium]